jgi:hypothetical protein
VPTRRWIGTVDGQTIYTAESESGCLARGQHEFDQSYRLLCAVKEAGNLWFVLEVRSSWRGIFAGLIEGVWSVMGTLLDAARKARAIDVVRTRNNAGRDAVAVDNENSSS